MQNWYFIENIIDVDSPSLVLYEDRLMHNLGLMLKMVNNDVSKLMPHIKTNKMPEVIRRMINLGLKNFKASTIAEAEIAATEGADSVFIAHQLVGPKIQRFANLSEHFPKTKFATLVDNIDTIKALDTEATKRNISIEVYIDINSGMHRSGIEIGQDLDHLIDQLSSCKTLLFKGLHVYDGHFRGPDFKDRQHKVESEFKVVNALFEKLRNTFPDLNLVCGGTPTFTSHLLDKGRICSPGTCVFWDWSYNDKLREQEFKYAVLLISRVISKPTKGIITIDMGHKSVAPENSIDKRIKFLNLMNYELISQSEEHGVLEVKDWDALKVGDVLYGVPYHICPTINLHDSISVIENRRKVGSWEITGRQRRITF